MSENILVEEQAIEECALEVEEKLTEELDMGLPVTVVDQYKNKLAEYNKIVAATDVKLGRLQDFTEEVFLKIGEKLPAINAALRNTDSEANHLLAYFKKESGLLIEEKEEAVSDLTKLNRASGYLIKVVNDQGDAFLQMSDMMKRIENIKNSIESIRDFSAEMEMLSLNAAIVAIKAGDSGRTLNPITVELKKMANSAILLIDEIVDTSEQLAEKYSLFEEISETQAKSCKSDVEKTSETLSERYNNLQVSILGLVERLEQVTAVVNDSRQPINNIMNTLQVQDILKQCTDHVRLSLKEAGSEMTSDSDITTPSSIKIEHLLDAIEFQEKVPLLCVQLLDDIDERLRDSIEGLEGGFGTINNLLQAITVCSVDQTSMTSIDNSSLDNIEESFRGVENVVVETAVMIQNAANSWEQLWSTAVGLETMLETLERQFRQLKKLTNFHLINIPIKIEVARSVGLSKDGELSQRVEGLAEYISTEMRQSHKAILQDYQFLSQMVVSMNKHKKDVEANLESIAFDIDELLGNFSKAKGQVRTTLACVCDHINELAKLVQTSLSDLDRINSLIDENSVLKEDFRILVDMACHARESVMSAIGAGDWELHDGRLKDIVNKFTVLAHKKIAGDLYDVDVEEGNREGELILF